MTSLPSAHEFLCDQGILHCDISAGNIMLPAATPPEIVVLPVRTPGGGMTAPTVRSHTIFGPDVMRGAVMTVRLSRCHGAVDLLNIFKLAQ